MRRPFQQFAKFVGQMDVGDEFFVLFDRDAIVKRPQNVAIEAGRRSTKLGRAEPGRQKQASPEGSIANA